MKILSTLLLLSMMLVSCGTYERPSSSRTAYRSNSPHWGVGTAVLGTAAAISAIDYVDTVDTIDAIDYMDAVDYY
tara:strand:- start:3158 stop:3382 length:225 start_codon:yes stop_codon:yes gene_type:complete